MILDAETYESDGEQYDFDGAIAQDKELADDALKNTYFKTRSKCCAAIKLHSSEHTYRVLRAGNYGGSTFKMRCVA